MSENSGSTAKFRIKYPLLWLTVAIAIVYFPTLNLGFTQLDDSIFIQENQAYNEDLSNFFTSFTRGVFHETDDTYYRPLMVNSILLNYQLSGQNLQGYHLVNIILHLLSTILLFRLFIKLDVQRTNAFWLCLIFAIHPVLTQAVTWIPGRNDTLLAIFTFIFLITSINYVDRGRLVDILVSAIGLACALFTKETALLAPLAGLVLLLVLRKVSWKNNRFRILLIAWALGYAFYLWVKSSATVQSVPLDISGAINNLFTRIPLVVQYIGKIILPFNLSVFPVQQDTVYFYGFLAILFLGLIVWLSRKNDARIMITGVLVFLIFLTPALLVPYTINEQAFEHRLYLPMTGMLLFASQTVLFRNKFQGRQMLFIVLIYCVGLALLNYKHQRNFADPVVFWRQAAETSPNSAYALMMYGARAEGRPNKYALIRRAYAINPDEKYLNYYYGLMMLEQDSIDKAEQHFLKEKNHSGYYECDFHLARIAFERRDFQTAARYMEAFLEHDPSNAPAHSNLLLLYIDMGEIEAARQQASKMQKMRIPIDPAIMQRMP